MTTRTATIAAAALCLAWQARAAEVTTNGTGGGPWGDPATWRGNAAPGPDDDAVVRKGDVVTFDRNDDGKVTCQKLLIDPKGGLKFKTGAGKVVFTCAAGVESYGPIMLDGTRAAGDFLELRMAGADPDRRAIKLLKGGALTARGRPGLPKGARNVVVSSPPFAGAKRPPIAAALTAVAGTTLDLRAAELAGVQVSAADIDSTGAKAGERLSVVGNRFTGLGRFACTRCDTPTITGNAFGHPDPKRREGRAVHVSESPLAEVKDNSVTGGFDYGIAVSHGADAVVSGNTVSDCTRGIHLGFGSGHAVSRNVVRGCEVGYEVHYTARATLEDNAVEGAKTAVDAIHTNSQITTLRATKPAPGGAALRVVSDGNSRTQLVLLNCGIRPEDVKLQLGVIKKEGTPPPVLAMEFLVVRVKNAPADAEVEVKAAGGEKDEAAVRNSPAPLAKGLTPLPRPPGTPLTVSPLVVRSWALDADGKVELPPLYSVRVLAPADKPGGARKLLGFATATPGEKWYRPKVDDPAPTLEVPVK